MKQERKNLTTQERGQRKGQQGQELQETELNQNPNVQEVGFGQELEEGRLDQNQSEREPKRDREQLTEKSDRRL